MTELRQQIRARLGVTGIGTVRSLIGEYGRTHPYRTIILVSSSVVMGFLESVGVLALIPVLVLLIQQGANEGRTATLVRTVLDALHIQPKLDAALLILIGFAVLNLFVRIVLLTVQGRFFVDYMQEMRQRLIDAVIKARADYILHQSSGSLATVLDSLIAQYDTAMKSSFGLLGRAIQVGFYLIAALVVSWWLTLAAFVVSIVIAVVLYPTGFAIHRASHIKTGLMIEIIGLFVEMVQGMKPLKAMGRTGSLVQVFNKKLAAFRDVHIKEVVAATIRAGAPEALLVLAIAGALWWVQSNPQQGLVNLAVMLVILARTTTQLNILLTRLQQILSNQGAVVAVRTKLKQFTAAEEYRSGRVVPTFDEAIRFEDVSLAYGKNVVVSDLNARFDARRLHVLTGPSGVGKTSLCDTIIGLLMPNSGRVTIDGVDLKDIDVATWRNMIGYVPQDPFMFNDTVRTNLSFYDPRISDDNILWALDASEAREVVESLPAGLDTVLGERGMRMSGGQRQRLSIARALVRRPKLVILDEATSALDNETESAIARTLQRLSRVTTIIAISHQSCLPAYAHQVVMIGKGAGGAGVVTRASSVAMQKSK